MSAPNKVEEILRGAEGKMQKTLEATQADFAGVRTGRASPALLDRLHVEAYGTHVPLKQVATVVATDVRSLAVNAFDRATVGAIRKAIETSDLGLVPRIDGSTVRLSLPPLNEERRKELVKLVRKKAEEHRVALRGVRHKALEELKALSHGGHIPEDEHKRAGERLQKLTDHSTKDLDALLAGKEKEIMEV
ncbi:MAG: ribosome recycling factor [Vulcanimicrobiaceae bacterium]